MLFSFRYFKQIYYAIGFLFLIILTGTLGYVFVEDYTPLEAFYMTIVTVSTVGFNEVHPLSDAGRLFTSFLIITSFGTFAYAIASITGYILSGEYKAYFKDYRVKKELHNLKNHVIVCGYGRNGKQAIRTLTAYNQPFVLIEKHEDTLTDLEKEKDLLYVIGDAMGEDYLKEAGIERAKALITTLPKDSDNVFVVLTARELNKKLTIISRASESSSVKKMRMAGADNVIMPDAVGGAHMASLVVTPDVNEFLDHISIQGPGETNLEEITFSNLPDDFKYKTIKELGSKVPNCPLVIGFKTPEGDYIINPRADMEIIPDSKLFVLGTTDEIENLNRIFRVNV